MEWHPDTTTLFFEGSQAPLLGVIEAPQASPKPRAEVGPVANGSVERGALALVNERSSPILLHKNIEKLKQLSDVTAAITRTRYEKELPDAGLYLTQTGSLLHDQRAATQTEMLLHYRQV
jgi:hypothetical protein